MTRRAAPIVFSALLLFGCSIILAAPSRSSSRQQEKQSDEAPAQDAWPKLTPEQQEQAIAALKEFAEDAQTRLDRPLRLFETKYFLFYSDLSPQEAQNWAGLLDRMYARLAEMFAVPEGENIWRGKALVFVFSRKEDYRRYESEIMRTKPGDSAGMCHSSDSGSVKIAFYRQPEQLEFAHVLVHESVHGFIHRYRTPVRIPSWANEGLAETIATDLVPQNGHRQSVKASACDELREHHNSMGDFFTADHIKSWQYPVAEMLCTFMIEAGRKNYVDFISGIKDGLTWDQSLETRYKAPVDRLVRVYGQWLGVKDLQQ